MKEILTYNPPELRAALKKAWEESSAYHKKNGVYPRMRLGFLLWHTKRKQLYKIWGYRTLVQYLNTELGGLQVITANFYSTAAHRLWRFFGYSPDELEQFDLISVSVLRRCISLADTREEFERYLEAGPGVFRNNRLFAATIPNKQILTWPRRHFRFNGQSFRLIDRLLSHIAKCLELEVNGPHLCQEQALTVVALTYETLINHVPRDRKRLEAALRREFIRYDLPVEAAQLAKMQWHRMRAQSRDAAKLQEIAAALVEEKTSINEIADG